MHRPAVGWQKREGDPGDAVYLPLLLSMNVPTFVLKFVLKFDKFNLLNFVI